MAAGSRLLLLLLQAPAARAWNEVAPAAPVNITVSSWHHRAELRWVNDHEAGGLPTHYVVKWQAKGSEEVYWHPEWVGVGSELVQLEQLFPGRTYAVRVAAVNTQGRAWSDAAVFKTLSPIRCAESDDYFPLLDEAEQHQLCVQQHADPEASVDPDARKCPPGVTEYLLAGIAAGSTIALVAIAMLGKGRLMQPQVMQPTRLCDETFSDIDAATLHSHDAFMNELRRSSCTSTGRRAEGGLELEDVGAAAGRRGGDANDEEEMRDHGQADGFSTPHSPRREQYGSCRGGAASSDAY